MRVEHGANPNVKSNGGRTPIHLAAERNTGFQVIKLLLEYGVNLNVKTVDGHTPLCLAQLNAKPAASEYNQHAGGRA